MSIEHAQAFYSRMNTDSAFLDQVENAASPEDRYEIIQAAGYDFSQEELSEAEALEVSAGRLEVSRGGGYRGFVHNKNWILKPGKGKSIL